MKRKNQLKKLGFYPHKGGAYRKGNVIISKYEIINSNDENWDKLLNQKPPEKLPCWETGVNPITGYKTHLMNKDRNKYFGAYAELNR